jgi:hypothetical protein
MTGSTPDFMTSLVIADIAKSAAPRFQESMRPPGTGIKETSLDGSTIRGIAGIAEDERGFRAALIGGVDGVLHPPVVG